MGQAAAMTDMYKTNHHNMYTKGTVRINSNLTPRKSRLKGINAIVVFGIQYFFIEYLLTRWNNDFFNKPKEVAIAKYKRLMDFTLGAGTVTTKHLEDLHDLGYLPLHIKVLPEGTLCPIGVPCLTMTNTVDHAYWLVNYLETILSCTVWQPITSATIAREYRLLLNKYALETTGNTDGVQWQGHDFSMRGMSSLESACTSGAAHLLSFTGTDTIPAIEFLEQYYGADVEKELIGASVPATEHSVMCMGMKDGEIETFKTLLQDYFNAPVLSVVSDTWNLWDVVKPGGHLTKLKDLILSRPGKLVIRPDSGDPVDILCGTHHQDYVSGEMSNEQKGVIQLLWDTFGGTEVKGADGKMYKVLDSHIGAIYGDSITLERTQQICERLKAKGFASTNVVLGIGSYTYQYNTRDTFGFAVKATYGEVLEESEEDDLLVKRAVGREIFKNPITDDGTKKSAKGLLCVLRNEEGKLYLKDQCTPEEEKQGLLETVFLDGKLVKFQTLAEIRDTLSKQK
jgi:nicotinamide phosphoribosyltransferase